MTTEPVAAAVTPIVAMSRFVVANGMVHDVKQAFRERPHLVDRAPGFIRMEVLSPRDAPEEIWLMTWWRDEPSFHAWHGSQDHKLAHAGIPRGLKLVPGETQLRFLERVSS